MVCIEEHFLCRSVRRVIEDDQDNWLSPAIDPVNSSLNSKSELDRSGRTSKDEVWESSMRVRERNFGNIVQLGWKASKVNARVERTEGLYCLLRTVMSLNVVR